MRYLCISALRRIAPALLFLTNQQLAYAQNTDDPFGGLPLSGCPTDNPSAAGVFQTCFPPLAASLPPECGLSATSLAPTCVPYCKSVLVTQGGECFSSFCPQQLTAWSSWWNSICDDITATGGDDTTTSSGSSATRSTRSTASTSTESDSTTTPARTTTPATQTTAGAGPAATSTTMAGPSGGAGRIDSAVGIGGAVVGIIGALAVIL